MPASLVYLNGRYLPRDQATLSVDERGFVFGDGIYEVTRAHDGRFFEAERHLQRLAYGLRELSIGGAPSSEALLEIHDRLLRENDLLVGGALVYLQITRGVAPRTHQFPAPAVPPTVFLSASAFTPHLQQRERGAPAITVPDTRWARCDIKTVNLFPNVLAKQAAAAAGVVEAIFVRDGAITEGSHTNVFGIIDGELRTYPRSNYILGGVTRDVVVEIGMELGVPVREMPIQSAEVGRLEELFISGTTTDVTPIITLDGHPVASGRPGPIARAIYEALVERVTGAGVAR